MYKYDFREYADFGLEPKLPSKEEINQQQEKVIKPINLEYVLNDLKKQKLGAKLADGERFFGEITWGTETGATKLYFTPYRGLRAIIRRKSTDLQGESIWICKKVIEVRNLYDEQPGTLTMQLYENLHKIDAEMIDSAQKIPDFDVERFVLHLAHVLRRDTTERVLMYEGIRRLIEGEKYIIHWGCTGMGRQSQDQRRLDQFQVQVELHKNRGCLRITGNEVGSKIKDYKWQISPSQFDEFFFPSQPEEEIIRCVLHSLNSY